MTTKEHVDQIAAAMLVAIDDVASRVGDPEALFIEGLVVDGQYASVEIGEGNLTTHIVEVDTTNGRIMA